MPAFLHVGCLPFPFLRAYFLAKDIKVKKSIFEILKVVFNLSQSEQK